MLAQTSPGGLGLATDPRFAYPSHLQLIDREIVEAIARGRERRRAIEAGEPIDDRPEILLIEVPPRHGKSTIVSEHTPAWYLGCFPDRRVALCTYGGEFAATWGVKARDKLELHGEALFGVEVDTSTRASSRWKVAGHKGGMITAGVGGRLTGEGADLLIIDDPTKNAEEALSEVIRAKHWDWWLSTARTRLEPGGVVIVLMTRWHEADLGGMLLAGSEDGGDPVREIRMPALAEEDDVLGRAPGEALWPTRYTARYLAHTRSTIGPYWFAAMYQGTPTPDDGGIFARKYFHYFELDDAQRLVTLTRPDGTKQSYGYDWCTKFQTIDLAAGEKETSDYTVMLEGWATPDGDLLVRSVHRDRISVTDQPDFVRDHHAGGRVGIESIGYQSGLVKALLRVGLPAEAVYPDKDKVTRAGLASALYKGGKVYHQRGAEWLGDFELELLAFPAGEHDDQVDALAYAAKWLPDIQATHRVQKSRGSTLTGGLRTKQL